VVATFLLATVSTAQEHNHTHKTDKKTESKTENQQMMDAKNIDKNNDGKVYQCSMCSDQISDKPGECQKCGMKLSEVSVDDANKKMMKEHGNMKGHDKMMKEHGEKMDHSNMNHSKMESSIVREGVINLSAIDKNRDGKVYQDTMDWNVISDEAGDCPVCGMTLIEVTLDEAKKNLERKGFKVK